MNIKLKIEPKHMPHEERAFLHEIAEMARTPEEDVPADEDTLEEEMDLDEYLDQA